MQAKRIALPRVFDSRGNLTFIENQRHIPFDIQRVYWLYAVPAGESSGGHADYEQQELIIALSGSFEVLIKVDGKQKRYLLNQPDQGLFVPKLHGRLLDHFSTGAVALVLTDRAYDVKEFLRDDSESNDFLPEQYE
jgi:hypothetical protein